MLKSEFCMIDSWSHLQKTYIYIYIWFSTHTYVTLLNIYIYTLTSTHLIYISSTKKGLGFKGLTYDRFVFLQIFFVIKVNYNESIYYI
jgi:hypothetical protein